jgi:hypothetical protein
MPALPRLAWDAGGWHPSLAGSPKWNRSGIASIQ